MEKTNRTPNPDFNTDLDPDLEEKIRKMAAYVREQLNNICDNN